MSSEQYEVEIKSLLGSAEAAEKLRANMKAIDPATKCVDHYTQLNHYFQGGDPAVLVDRIASHITEDEHVRMQKIASEGKKISVRSREMNNDVRLVMKASIGDDTSANGVMRLEVEAPVSGLSLDELDAEILAAGYTYQAKWSRTREEYKLKDFSVCLDKNAGYGYLAEVEKIVPDAALADQARQEIETFMQELGIVELAQDRLERMFAYYNAHWPEYYGTENIFTIE